MQLLFSHAMRLGLHFDELSPKAFKNKRTAMDDYKLQFTSMDAFSQTVYLVSVGHLFVRVQLLDFDVSRF